MSQHVGVVKLGRLQIVVRTRVSGGSYHAHASCGGRWHEFEGPTGGADVAEIATTCAKNFATRLAKPSKKNPSERLFIGVYPEGIVYADRSREVHGDYARLGFLDFATLTLDLKSGVPADLLRRIKAHSKKLQSMVGQPLQVSSSGQTITLGYRLGKKNLPSARRLAGAARAAKKPKASTRKNPGKYAFRKAAAGDYAGSGSSAGVAATLMVNASRAVTGEEIAHALDQVSYLAACKTISQAQAKPIEDMLIAKLSGPRKANHWLLPLAVGLPAGAIAGYLGHDKAKSALARRTNPSKKDYAVVERMLNPKGQFPGHAGSWYGGGGIRNLTQTEVRECSAALRAIGAKLPRLGYCVRLPDGREVCRDHRGYYFVGSKKANPDSRSHRAGQATARAGRAVGRAASSAAKATGSALQDFWGGLRSNPNDGDRANWIANDEGLYDWQRRSRLSMREFIRLHRAEIDEVMQNISTGKKRGHYLKYGANPRAGVPDIEGWKMFAGGTGAVPGKHSYTFDVAEGRYMIDPASNSRGQHKGYVLYFLNEKGARRDRQGLYQQVGTSGQDVTTGTIAGWDAIHRSPRGAATAAHKHHARVFGGRRSNGRGCSNPSEDIQHCERCGWLVGDVGQVLCAACWKPARRHYGVSGTFGKHTKMPWTKVPYGPRENPRGRRSSAPSGPASSPQHRWRFMSATSDTQWCDRCDRSFSPRSGDTSGPYECVPTAKWMAEHPMDGGRSRNPRGEKDKEISRLRGMVTRLKAAKRKAVMLADKIALDRQVKAAEEALRQAMLGYYDGGSDARLCSCFASGDSAGCPVHSARWNPYAEVLVGGKTSRITADPETAVFVGTELGKPLSARGCTAGRQQSYTRAMSYVVRENPITCPGCEAHNPTTAHLVKEYLDLAKHRFGIHGGNAARAQNAVGDMLLARGVREIPNIFGAIEVQGSKRKNPRKKHAALWTATQVRASGEWVILTPTELKNMAARCVLTSNHGFSDLGAARRFVMKKEGRSGPAFPNPLTADESRLALGQAGYELRSMPWAGSSSPQIDRAWHSGVANGLALAVGKFGPDETQVRASVIRGAARTSKMKAKGLLPGRQANPLDARESRIALEASNGIRQIGARYLRSGGVKTAAQAFGRAEGISDVVAAFAESPADRQKARSRSTRSSWGSSVAISTMSGATVGSQVAEKFKSKKHKNPLDSHDPKTCRCFYHKRLRGEGR